MDRLATDKPSGQARSRDRHFSVVPTDQVHLDPTEVGVIPGLVVEAVEGKIATKLAVDPFEDVEVEPGGDSPGESS